MIHSDYCARLGWYLVAIPAGTKGPTSLGWQRPERAISTAEAAADYWGRYPTHNVGLLHGPSGTCAIDVDHVENTRLIFEEFGIDYDALLSVAPRIQGRKDRGKFLFRAPHGIDKTHKISWPSREDPRRTEVVFELRAGAVQDVLPPSIHPDTGKAYTWEGPDVWDGLPELPAQLVTLWTEWDRFRPQMQDICPWRQKREVNPPRKPRPQGDRTSVIDAFNAHNDMHELLVRFGYKPTRRGRYLSPNSSSGIAGVVLFDDGRAYSHHASDPFDSAHTFDAFDLWCHYDHMGDVAKAVKDAAQFLHINNDPALEYDEEAIRHGAKVAAQIMGAKPVRGPLDAVPEHLLSIPGVLQDFVNHFNTTAVMEQPQFAVQGALALGSTVMGRRWRTASNNYSSMYYIAVGPTGCGKEYIRKCITKVLADAGLERMIGPSSYTSASGVLSALKSKPVHVTVVDEIGRKLKQAAMRDNSHAQGMLTALMEVFGMQDGVLLPQGYSTMGLNKSQADDMGQVVRNPSLTLIGMSTPSDFFGALSSGDVASGFLNRFLIVATDIGIPRPKMARVAPISERLLDWCRTHAEAHGGGGNLASVDSHDIPPAPVIVPFTAQAQARLEAVADEIWRYRQANLNSPLEAMKSRSWEITMRLSLVVARSKGETEISEASVCWAWDFVSFYTERAIAALHREMAEGPFQAVCKKVAEKIRSAGLRGMTENELARSVSSYGALEPRKRKEVMEALVSDHGVMLRKSDKPTRGFSRMSWIMPVDDAGTIH